MAVFPDLHDAPGNDFQLVGVEMQEVQSGRHFQISKVISTDMEARVACGNGERLVCHSGEGRSLRWGRPGLSRFRTHYLT
jgi:hypothetical protein